MPDRTRKLVKGKFKLVYENGSPVKMFVKGDDDEYLEEGQYYGEPIEPDQIPSHILAAYLHMEAESGNRDDCYIWLVKTIQKVTGSELITRKIMLEIYGNEGLYDPIYTH